MQNLVCFKHSEYRGDTAPSLSCKACCGIFISQIKEQNMAATGTITSPREWIEKKAKEAEAASRAKARAQNDYTSF